MPIDCRTISGACLTAADLLGLLSGMQHPDGKMPPPMPHRYSTDVFNLTSFSDPRLGGRLTTSGLLTLVAVFISTGEDAGLILGGALFCVAWPAFISVWSNAECAPSSAIDSSQAGHAPAGVLPFALPTARALLRGVQRPFVPMLLPRLQPQT